MSTQRRVQVVFEAVLNNFTSNVREAARTTLEVGEAGRRASRETDFTESTRSSGRFETSIRGLVSRLREVSQGGREASSQVNFQDSIESAKNLTSEIFSIKNVIGALVATIASKKMLDFTIGASFDEEQVRMQYEVLLKSAEEAEKRFKEVYKIGLETPYENEELLQADKILTGFNIRTKDMLMLMGDVGAAMQDPKQAIVELSKYMGQLSAGQSGLALARFEELGIVTRAQLREMGLEFDKANSYVGDTKDLFEAIIEVMEGRYGGMMDKLAGTGKGLIATIQDTIGEFGRNIGNNAIDQAKGSMETFLGAVERAEQNGSLERLTTILGGLLATLFEKLAYGLDNLDSVIEWITNFATTAQENFYRVIGIIKVVIATFLGFKVITSVISIIFSFIQTIATIKDVADIVKTALSALWGVMTTHPILAVIVVVLLLINWLIKLSRGFSSTEEFGKYMLEGLKLAFYQFGEVVWSVITLVLSLLEKLLGNIPLIGTAISKMKDFANSALKGFQEEIENTKGKMRDLRDEASEPINFDVRVNYNMPSMGDQQKVLDMNAEAGKYFDEALNATGTEKEKLLAKARSAVSARDNYTDNLNKNNTTSGKEYPLTMGGGRSSGKKGSSSTAKKVTASNKITSTKDKTQSQIDMYDSRAELARARKDRASEKQNLNHMLYVMNKQAKDLLTLQNKSKGAEKNKVETERNKLLAQIAQTTEEIRKSYIEESIEKVKDGFQTAIDLYTSRAEVAEVNENNKGYRQSLNHALYEMKEQAKNLLGLQEKSKGKDKSIVEVARNKLLVEIARVTEDIKNGINKMVGEFNVPSELRKLTEYQYKVQNSSGVLTKQLVVSPDIRMYLTVEDTDGKGADQIQQEIKAFTSAIFQKDDLVSLFTRDVTRN